MTTTRLAAAAALLAVVACSGQPSAERRAADTATDVRVVACGEDPCPWIVEPGACQQIATGAGLSGTFADVLVLEPAVGTTTVTADGATYTLTLAADLHTFDWTATRQVDFVIAQGSAGANVYFYDPPVTADTALTPFILRPLAAAKFCVAASAGSLVVEKTASAASTRTFGWAIAKSSPTTTLTLAPGSTAPVSYAVTLTATPFDSDFAVTGTITVHNPTAVAATGVTLADSFAGAPVVPDCGAFEGTLAPGATLVCSYALAPGAAVDAVNVVTVTTAGGPAGATAAAPVIFGPPATVVDACVTVADAPHGALGTACAAESPKTFSYVQEVGPFACDPTGEGLSFDNTASFTAPSGATGSATWSVQVLVPCSAGCTLTQGYWKTHSREGPAPSDPGWRNVGPLAEDTPFFLSGQTWLELFRTPVRGSAYVSLAHQYMAAKLNVLAGASPAAVGPTLAACEAFFAANGPGAPLTAAQRAELLRLAALLDAFNEGRIGPGHCGAPADGSCP